MRQAIELRNPLYTEIGDADNDGDNEIIVGCWQEIRIYGYDSTEDKYSEQYSISSLGQNDSPTIADVDNDGKNEVISGGSYSTVRIWKYNGSGFEKLGEEAVDGFSQGVRVGDLNHDGDNELLVGAGRNLYVFDFKNEEFTLEWSISQRIGVHIPGLVISDIDNDEKQEFMVYGYGMPGWAIYDPGKNRGSSQHLTV